MGSELVRKLLEAAQATDVFLTTLEQSIPFYAPHGFQRIRLSAAPRCRPFLTINVLCDVLAHAQLG